MFNKKDFPVLENRKVLINSLKASIPGSGNIGIRRDILLKPGKRADESMILVITPVIFHSIFSGLAKLGLTKWD
jgi:hypothetical protein